MHGMERHPHTLWASARRSKCVSLNAKATLETNLEVDRVDGPLMYMHDKGLGFQSFGVANNNDFAEEALVAYIITLPNQPLSAFTSNPKEPCILYMI